MCPSTSKNKLSRTVAPLSSKIILVNNKNYCKTPKNKSNNTCNHHSISKKCDSPKIKELVTALRFAAEPTTLHVKHAHFVADIEPLKHKKITSKSDKKKWKYLEKYYSDYFGADGESPPSNEGKKCFCANYIHTNRYPISNPTTLVTHYISTFISKLKIKIKNNFFKILILNIIHYSNLNLTKMYFILKYIHHTGGIKLQTFYFNKQIIIN